MWQKENPQAWMKKDKDDIWVLEKPLVTNQFFFTYKFALFDKDRKFMYFERGIDRICDAELKDAAPNKFPREYYDYRSNKNHQTEPVKEIVKRIEMNLGWESFKVCFSICYPIDDPNDCMTLLGSQEETQNQQMLKLPRKLDWMHCKYGDDTTPFEVTILMANNQGGVNGAWFRN